MKCSPSIEDSKLIKSVKREYRYRILRLVLDIAVREASEDLELELTPKQAKKKPPQASLVIRITLEVEEELSNLVARPPSSRWWGTLGHTVSRDKCWLSNALEFISLPWWYVTKSAML